MTALALSPACVAGSAGWRHASPGTRQESSGIHPVSANTAVHPPMMGTSLNLGRPSGRPPLGDALSRSSVPRIARRPVAKLFGRVAIFVSNHPSMPSINSMGTWKCSKLTCGESKC
jgi:hypothetical protein